MIVDLPDNSFFVNGRAFELLSVDGADVLLFVMLWRGDIALIVICNAVHLDMYLVGRDTDKRL